jgi:hypothetical protein
MNWQKLKNFFLLHKTLMLSMESERESLYNLKTQQVEKGQMVTHFHC